MARITGDQYAALRVLAVRPSEREYSARIRETAPRLKQSQMNILMQCRGLPSGSPPGPGLDQSSRYCPASNFT